MRGLSRARAVACLGAAFSNSGCAMKALHLIIVDFALGLALLLGTILPAYPHGGGLDSYGCHHNRKAGGYHCHRGPLAGQSFGSQEEMLRQIKADNSKDRKIKSSSKD